MAHVSLWFASIPGKVLHSTGLWQRWYRANVHQQAGGSNVYVRPILRDWFRCRLAASLMLMLLQGTASLILNLRRLAICLLCRSVSFCSCGTIGWTAWLEDLLLSSGVDGRLAIPIIHTAPWILFPVIPSDPQWYPVMALWEAVRSITARWFRTTSLAMEVLLPWATGRRCKAPSQKTHCRRFGDVKGPRFHIIAPGEAIYSHFMESCELSFASSRPSTWSFYVFFLMLVFHLLIWCWLEEATSLCEVAKMKAERGVFVWPGMQVSLVSNHIISSDFLMRSMLPLKERSRPVGCDFTQTQCGESPYCILCFFWAPAVAAAGGIGALPRCFGLTLSDCHFHHMR